MTADEFNRYCAEVMRYADTRLVCGDYGDFDPATDLNQMAEVFDNLLNELSEVDIRLHLVRISRIRSRGIAQAMREFIESTKEE